MNKIIYFSYASLAFVFIIAIVYFRKKKVNTIEIKLFTNILLLTIACLIFEIMSAFVFMNSIVWLKIFLKKLFLISMVLLVVNYLKYTIILIKGIDYKFSKIENIIFYSFQFIVSLIILFSSLYLNIGSDGIVINSYGLAQSIASGTCMALIVLIVILLVMNVKKISSKRAVPLLFLVILMFCAGYVQILFPSILLINFCLSIVVVIMSMTIENPDVKVIEQLNIARDTAEKANEAKTDFLSNMSHEIRTPLNAIVGFSNLLLEDETVPDSAKDEVRDIVMASDNLLEIVNGILDISKIEANKLEIVNTEYVFSKMCDELVALSIGRLGDKPIEFKTSFDPSIPKVLYGDVSRIKQICVNILTNAIKYTKEGWIEFKISGVIKNNVCRLIISVEDTGIGIKKENIDKLFNKFERLDLEENVTIEGTGLGLAITKKLVELMNGKIVVQSVFGKGSKFTISIDQRVVNNPTIKLEETEELGEKVITHNKKVLLVDDNKINLKVAERLLESYGIDTESVESGAAALEKIQNGEKYDMILLDDMMPKMSGVETLKKLKEIPGFKIITIALTANALTGMREKYLQDGFDDYLAKPINKNELNRIINKYLNDD